MEGRGRPRKVAWPCCAPSAEAIRSRGWRPRATWRGEVRVRPLGLGPLLGLAAAAEEAAEPGATEDASHDAADRAAPPAEYAAALPFAPRRRFLQQRIIRRLLLTVLGSIAAAAALRLGNRPAPRPVPRPLWAHTAKGRGQRRGGGSQAGLQPTPTLPWATSSPPHPVMRTLKGAAGGARGGPDGQGSACRPPPCLAPPTAAPRSAPAAALAPASAFIAAPRCPRRGH